MSPPPTYAPKDHYRTRQSGREVESVDELAATGLDRVVPELPDVTGEPAPQAAPPAPPPKKGPSPALLIGLIALVLGLPVLVLAALVVIAAATSFLTFAG